MAYVLHRNNIKMYDKMKEFTRICMLMILLIIPGAMGIGFIYLVYRYFKKYGSFKGITYGTMICDLDVCLHKRKYKNQSDIIQVSQFSQSEVKYEKRS